MGRRRTIPDAEIFSTVRRLLAQGGDKAVAFSSVARATGLAAPTLVQRYGSRDAMLRAALVAAWDDLDARTRAAATEAPLSRKGATQFLKHLGGDEAEAPEPALRAVDLRDAELRARAEAWRTETEAALALRLGGGAKGRDAAALLFAAWQGQVLWEAAGGRGMRLRDMVRRIGRA